MPAKKKASKKRKWTRRAMKHPEVHTKKNESVQTASGMYKGKEILFPTIRMRGPGLEKLPVERARREAIMRKDYIEFDTPEKATAYSRALSKSLGRSGAAAQRMKSSRKKKPRKK